MNPILEESTIGSNMPESSMQRRPIMIICDLPDGGMEQLQQIFMAQTPRVLWPKDCRDTLGDIPKAHFTMTSQEDGRVQGSSRSVRTNMLPHQVVKEFKECLGYLESNRLLEMVKQFPAQLFQHTVSKKFSRSALHVAVLENSQNLIHALLEKLEEGRQSTSKYSKMDYQDFILKVDEFGLSAVDMAALIGNEEILPHFGKILEFKKTDLEVLFHGSTNLFQGSEDEKRKLLEEASPLLDKQAPTSIHQGIGQLSIRQWLLKENIDFVYCLHEASHDASRDWNYSQQKSLEQKARKQKTREKKAWQQRAREKKAHEQMPPNPKAREHKAWGKKAQPQKALQQKAREELPLEQMPSKETPLEQMLMEKMPLEKMPTKEMPTEQMPMEQRSIEKKAYTFVKHVFENGDYYFFEPLFNIRDKFGRSPLHMHGYSFEWMRETIVPFLKMLVGYFPNLDLNMPDFSGRTPLHWAAAQGFVDIVTILTSQDQTNLNATFGNLCGWKIKENYANFNVDDVDDVTPLHLAVIHNHIEVVEALLKVPERQGLNVNAICMRKVQFSNEIFDEDIWHWTPFQLAAYMGHESILQMLLQDSRLYDPGLKKRKKNAPQGHNMIPSLHLATSQFHHLAVKALMEFRRMDILVKDKEGNTALHYATMHAHGQLQVHANLHDYVTVAHFTSKPPKPRKPSDHDIITCMEILMCSVLDVEKKNKKGVAPTLHSSCSKKVKNWWLENIAKEAEGNKNDLIIAANSVSVTAALVATVSFVGPLQPPLGLLNDGNRIWLNGYSNVKHTSVEVFLFCNSLSFYFAIAAIVFAMLPSWPIPREWYAKEGRIAHKCVQIAVLFLFGSIIFVICAFSAANIAIVPNKRWRYKTIVVISISLGVLICFIILFLVFMRLLILISSKNKVAKKISNFAIQMILWEWDIPIGI